LQTILAFLLLLYFTFTLLGGSFVGEAVWNAIFSRKTETKNECGLAIGLAIFAVIISYAGFAGAAKIPFAIETLGALLFLYGIWRSIIRLKNNKNPVIWFKLPVIIPVLFLLVYFISRKTMLTGGITHGDEMRSLTLTSAFATNFLKPAYPYDFSYPIVYPYYPFELSAFLYRSVMGKMFPSIPVFAISIFLIALFWRILFIICKKISPERGETVFTWSLLFLVFSGLQPFRKYFDQWLGDSEKIGTEILSMDNYFQSGYHYLFGVSAGMLAVLHLWDFFNEKKRADWILFISLISISAGFSGMSFAWIAICSALMILFYVIFEKKKAFISLVKSIPISAVLAVFFLLPQVFNFFPRLSPNFEFSSPHWWFPGSLLKQYLESPTRFPYWRFLWFGFDVLITQTGLIISAGLAISVYLALKWIIKERKFSSSRIVPVSFIALTGFLLLTFTISSSWDWHARGFLAPAIAGAVAASSVIFNMKDKPRLFALSICCAVLLIQTGRFSSSFISNESQVPSKTALDINKRFPFGIVVHRYRDIDTVNYESEPEIGLINEISQAGRSILIFTYAYVPYLNNPNSVPFIGDYIMGRPCSVTNYGKNTPKDWFIEMDDKLNFASKTCSEETIKELMAKPFPKIKPSPA